MSVSYPYFSIAKQHGFDYGYVLKVAHYMESYPLALAHWADMPPMAWSRDPHWLIAHAVRRELARRVSVSATAEPPSTTRDQKSCQGRLARS